MVDDWLNNILNRLLPQPCVLCGGQSSGTMALCDGCLADLPVLGETCLSCANPLDPRPARLGPALQAPLLQTRRCGQCQQHPPAFDTSLVFFPYAAPFDHLVQGMKFHDRLGLAKLLGQLMAMQLAVCHDGPGDLPDALLPVPLHARRFRQRGFNQALEIARPIGKALTIPVLHHSARRLRDTPAQSNLDLKSRRGNLRGAFHIDGRFDGRHIAIIDDVMTSGATMQALANCLKQHGAARVSAWCCCRATPPA